MAENKATPESDGNLQLKKRARRRLVGAVALALFAAIVLPMVMDHEPRPPVQDIQIRIPGQDTGSFSSRVLPAAKPAPTPLPPVPDKTESQPEAKLEPALEIKPEPLSEPKKAESKPEAKPVEVARAEKILAGETPEPTKEAPRKEAAKSEQWVLQLGAYQDQGNVKALQAKVKELGYASYTEKVGTPQGERIRVRAGPFASKDAAEKAQARLKKIGAGGPPGGVLATK